MTSLKSCRIMSSEKDAVYTVYKVKCRLQVDLLRPSNRLCTQQDPSKAEHPRTCTHYDAPYLHNHQVMLV